MSYILDALKKSEQARGNRKTRGLLEEPVEVTFIPSAQPRKSAPRWSYIVALILLLNIGFFFFWLHPWQWGAKVAGPGTSFSGGQSPALPRQAAPVIPPAPPAQFQAKQEATESQPGKEEISALNPPASDGVAPVLPGPSVSETQTHETAQDRIVENKISLKDQEAMKSLKTEPARTDQAQAQPPGTTPGVTRKDKVAVKKPPGSKLPQDPKSAETRKDLKTANLQAAPANKAVRAEQPLRRATGSGIMSDIQPLTELGASSSKPAILNEPKWHELAPQIRDSLPNLSVSMLIYSKTPKDRWININGSKRREGEEISEGLKVEEITPEGAIFSYQGHRFYKGVVGD